MKPALLLRDWALSVVLCEGEEPAPSRTDSRFYALVQVQDELSLVLESKAVPIVCGASVRVREQEDGWRCLEVAGPLDFNLTGILAGISQVLAEAGISIFAISSYKTDFILVKDAKLARATEALLQAGYNLTKAT